MYPQSIDEFTTKLNKVDGNTYVIEEEVLLTNGVYEDFLEHDNVTNSSVRVFTGSKLTGEKVENFILSTPSMNPWKKSIKIFSKASKVYITYETQGDTVEAEDINIVQDSIVNTQKTLNIEIDRAKNAEKVFTSNLNTEKKRADEAEKSLNNSIISEINRAKGVEKILTDSLDVEVNRAKSAEKTLTDNLASEISRANAAEKSLQININNEVDRATKTEQDINQTVNSEISRAKAAEKTLTDNLNIYKDSNNTEVQKLKEKDCDLDITKADKSYVDIELNKRYLKEQVFTKDEVLQKIKEVIGTAPQALDTLQEIAKSLNNDGDFAGSITKQLATKVDKIPGKQLSTEDYTTNEKNKLLGIEISANNYSHPSTHSADIIVENLNKRFCSDSEKNNWNDANSKKHTHGNLSLLDTITKTLVDSWNSAVSHIGDSIRHITADERSLWNTITNKVDKMQGKQLSTEDYTTAEKQKLVGIAAGANNYVHPNDSSTRHVTDVEKSNWNSKSDGNHNHDGRYYTEAEADSKFVTRDQLGNAGYGDMIKNIYDKNNNGKIDIAEVAESIEWSNVKNKPGSFPANGGNSNAINFIDNRSIDDKPKELNSRVLTANFKYIASVGSPPVGASGTYVYILNIVGWNSTEGSGGWPIQLAIGKEGLAYRQAIDADNWGDWMKISNKKDSRTWNDLKGV